MEMIPVSEKRKTFRRRILPAMLALPFLGAVPPFAGGPEIRYAPGQTVMTLEEYLRQSAEEWFLTGKTARTMQAMMVSKEMTFHNDFEVTDYTVTDDGETVVLKGQFGEMLASKLPKVIATYTKPDGSELGKEDFAVKDTYIEIATRSEPDTYWAMHIPVDISVAIPTAWGDVLHSNLPNAPHGDGDYLVCRRDASGGPDLSDVWILNGVVFPVYYSGRGTYYLLRAMR